MPLANKIRKTIWALRNRRRLMDVLREEYIKEEETAVLEIKQKEEEERRKEHFSPLPLKGPPLRQGRSWK